MKVMGQTPIQSYKSILMRPSTEMPDDSQEGEILATGIGISIRHKGESENVIQKNSPDDPMVSKKILDSLNLGLINFSQRERDCLASIFSDKATKVKDKSVQH